MALSRDQYAKQITDRLFDLANKLKTRTRANLTDANHSLETVMQRFFNALYAWELVNLNSEQDNYPAADLGDRKRRVAMQITNRKVGEKIIETAATADRHQLRKDFDRLVIFFLLEKKPAVPKSFVQPEGGPEIECWDITDLLKQIMGMEDLDALKHAAVVLEDEMSTDIVASPLQRYFVALRENFSTYENLGLPAPANAEGEKDVRIAIRDLFVDPACLPGRISPEKFDAALFDGKNPAEPLLPLLAGKKRRLVLLADPGMGKSTLVQWLITMLAEEAPLPAVADGLRGAVPLPFILRDIVGHLPEDVARWDWPALLKAFVQYHPRSADRPPLAAALVGDEAAFRTLLESKRAFFLIDGLDEIGDPARRLAVRNALWEGFRQYPSARWLVTSRWVGYEEAAVHEERKRRERYYGCGGSGQRGYEDYADTYAKLLYLAPFNDEQQLTFSRHWYLPRMGDVLGKEHASAFIKAVREHDSVRVIGRVPNLLYLLALLYRNRARLPHGRTHVYAAISEAYLGGIDLTKHLHVPYELAKKERLLATIARHMQERRASQAEGEKGVGEVLVKRTELERWLAPHFPGDRGHTALHAFIGYIAARSGLLLPRGEGVFGFAHLSFQEFYAACWLEEEFRRLLNAQARGGGSSFLRRSDDPEPASSLTRENFAALASQPVWREPLVFLVEKLSANADDALTLIDWLFPQLAQEPVSVKKKETPPELMPIEAARLLAALSFDPQVSLTLDQRKGIWDILWRAHLTQQDGRRKWHLVPSLLVLSEFQPLVWDTLASIQPKKLLLSNTDIVDLAPLANLTQLRSLDLHECTEISDLTPLTCLTNVESLWLDGCARISDLAPLAHLRKMKELNLSNCNAVADLAPLARLTKLETLYLKRCEKVADLAPLGSLSHLNEIVLDGCTSLSEQAVSAFRQIHPRVKVSGPRARKPSR